MSITYIFALVFSAISSICLLISTIAKKKHKLMLWQSFDGACNCLSCLLAGSLSGFTTSAVALTRNLIVFVGKMNGILTAIITIILIVIGVIFNNVGWIGILPIIAAVEYTVVVSLSNSVELIRLSLMLNMVLWCIHDVVVGLYPSAITLAAITIFDIGWLVHRWWVN